MLCQLSYAPLGSAAADCIGGLPQAFRCRARHMRARLPPVRGTIPTVGSLGLVALFTVLACSFAGIAAAGGLAGQWEIAAAAAVLAAWMASLASAALRKRSR